MICCSSLGFRLLRNTQSYCINSIKQSLRILKIDVPTSQRTIKKQYLQLAKKCHPDLVSSERPSNAMQNKEMHSDFVSLTKAYQYLRELTQDQINSNREQFKDGTPNLNQAKMSKEQKRRKETYEYFNQKYQKANKNAQFNIKNGNRQKLSIFTTVPQFFVGFLMLALVFGEWVFNSASKAHQVQPAKFPNASAQSQNAFKSMNPYRKFQGQFSRHAFGSARMDTDDQQ